MKWYEIAILIVAAFLVYYFIFSGESQPFIGIRGIKFTPKFRQRKEKSKGEGRCREVLQSIFGVHFPSTRPYFLKNPDTGKNLELDCYNPDLKIAVEYQGQQHYRFIKYFHKDEEAFRKQQQRDQYKKAVCESRGICLIEVPYTVPHNKIYDFLVDELRKRGKLPRGV